MAQKIIRTSRKTLIRTWSSLIALTMTLFGFAIGCCKSNPIQPEYGIIEPKYGPVALYGIQPVNEYQSDRVLPSVEHPGA